MTVKAMKSGAVNEDDDVVLDQAITELPGLVGRRTNARLDFAMHRKKAEARPNLCSQCEIAKIGLAAPSTRRSAQFLAALYIHTLMLVILLVFSRNLFSTAIRSALLGLFR